MMNMIFTKFAAAGIFLSLTLCSAAQAAEPGFYVGASIGKPSHNAGKSNGMVVSFVFPSPLSGAFFQVFPDAVNVKDSDVSWNATLGYRLNAYFGAELAYMDFGKADVVEQYRVPAPIGTLFVNLTRSFSSDIAGPAVSILGSLPFHEAFGVFVRAGVLFADQELEQRFTGGSQSSTFGDEILIGGIGAEWTFATRWTARLEYLRTEAMEANLISGEADLSQFALSVLFSL